MYDKNSVIVLLLLNTTFPICEGCIFGKHHKFPYPTDLTTRATEVLLLVHTDLWGLMKTPSLGGAFYFLVFIDDYTRYIHVYLF